MDGIIIINKTKGFTSHDIVKKVKKIFNEKVGHTGTLDPNATGVLPILIGVATKLSKYLINHDKIYIATLKLGERTDTADSEGSIIETKEVESINKNEIKKILNEFKGKQLQTPPIYSAIKINGKKLYNYARDGQTIEIPKRQIEIYEINLIENIYNEIKFKVSCSKGTYIRTLCENIAEKLNTVGYMKELERIKVGEFDITNSITIEELERKYNNKENIKIISIEELLKNKEKIILDNKKTELFLNGVKLKYNLKDDFYKIYTTNKFIGIGIIKDNYLKRDIII